MAYTQTDIDNLKRAIARGARRLKLGNGEEVEYFSLAEMRTALRDMEAEVAGNAEAGAFTVSYPRTSRGL
ncbi:hypothetical protein LCM17_23055 [Cereibacter sphaeroides]|nr:hypothetical protein [Cereibacter sphaeroides]